MGDRAAGSSATSFQIVDADLTRPDHQAAVVSLTAAYAADPMGNDAPLPSDVLARLVPGLAALSTTRIYLAYLDDQPVGIATCFLGFSTFKGRPLLNVHDLAVVPEHRGHGIGPRLLEAVIARASELGCCRVTLEINEWNQRAKAIYEGMGFSQVGAGSSIGGALFYSKGLEG